MTTTTTTTLYQSIPPHTSTNPLPDPYWSNGLHFQCTGCGRCCLNEGEVWFDSNEFTDLVDILHLPIEDVLTIYTDEIRNDWVRLKSKNLTFTSPSGNKEVIEGCIFLSSDDQKSCTIYSQRPIQCRTYPYWPSLLSNQQQWIEESVVPDDLPGKHWSRTEGGCEGINHHDAPLVLPQVIHQQKHLYSLYSKSFPFLSHDEDRDRFVSKVDLNQRVRQATKEWIQTFVIGYQLCPFALPAYSNDHVRYRISTTSDQKQVIELLKQEVLYLLTHPKEEVETTLLVFPFLTPEFEDFYEFTLELEDIILPGILKQFSTFASSPVSTTTTSTTASMEDNHNSGVEEENSGGGNNSGNRNKLYRRYLKKKHQEQPKAPVTSSSTSGGYGNKKMDQVLQLACFHPGFVWGEDKESIPALDFEKKSPFPTINILRGEQIRAYANELQTAKIASRNKNALIDAGEEKLAEQFSDILRRIL
eukprot:gene6228-6867_t